jgi:hypothetical protein
MIMLDQNRSKQLSTKNVPDLYRYKSLHSSTPDIRRDIFFPSGRYFRMFFRSPSFAFWEFSFPKKRGFLGALPPTNHKSAPRFQKAKKDPEKKKNILRRACPLVYYIFGKYTKTTRGGRLAVHTCAYHVMETEQQQQRDDVSEYKVHPFVRRFSAFLTLRVGQKTGMGGKAKISRQKAKQCIQAEKVF